MDFGRNSSLYVIALSLLNEVLTEETIDRPYRSDEQSFSPNKNSGEIVLYYFNPTEKCPVYTLSV